MSILLDFMQTPLSQIIRDMFKSSEQGVLYDPSDFSTLYQDASGTTPVTALGQPVGLMLDKRLGLVLGPELVSNGGFDTDTVWVKGTGWSIGSGKATFNPAGQAANSDLYAPLSSSKDSAQTADISANGAFTVYLAITAGGGHVKVTGEVSGRTAGTIRVLTASGRVYIRALNGTGFDGSIDNISVRELPGNHATQSTAASRPMVEARVNLQTQSSDWNISLSSDGTATRTQSSDIPVSSSSFSSSARVDKVGAISTFYEYIPAASAPVGNNVINTRSFYFKPLSNVDTFGCETDLSARFRFRYNIATGVITLGVNTESASVVAVGNGWYRASVTQKTAVADSTYLFLVVATSPVAADPASFLVIGWQTEVDTKATTYQRVNTATDYVDVGAARYELLDKVDDHLTVADGGAGTTGILLAVGVMVPAAGTARTIWSDRGTNTGYRLSIDATNKVTFSGGTGASFTTLTSAGALTAGTKYILIAWHDGTNLNLSINNVPETPVACGTVTAGTSSITIGKDNGAASGYWGDRIYSMVYRKNDASTASLRSSLFSYIVGKMGGL